MTLSRLEGEELTIAWLFLETEDISLDIIFLSLSLEDLSVMIEREFTEREELSLPTLVVLEILIESLSSSWVSLLIESEVLMTDLETNSITLPREEMSISLESSIALWM